MLLRMYVRWGEKQRYKTRVVEKSPGEEAGIKSATVELEGRFAYGYLSGEKGTHRIVRQSPFNAKGLRQVVFAFDSFALASSPFLPFLELNAKDCYANLCRQASLVLKLCLFCQRIPSM
jgi:protein subunit release factor B